jgi:hypothetical protein
LRWFFQTSKKKIPPKLWRRILNRRKFIHLKPLQILQFEFFFPPIFCVSLKPPLSPKNRRKCLFFLKKNMVAFQADFTAANDQKPREMFSWAQDHW